jgi:methylenetetrahydrofolate reductase (NADPH)
MRIPELLKGPEPCFSFEFFPPKSPEGEVALLEAIEQLAPLRPDFVSVTYGAAGSTRDGTVDIAARIKRERGIETMAHLSCVGETVEGLESILDRLAEAGIENVLALRGDPPRGEGGFVAPEGGLRGSAELAAFIRARREWGIGGSSFPEVHPDAASPQADIDYLREKVEGGAEFLITQLFFDNGVFFDWLAAVRRDGITVPVIAGLMPITSLPAIRRICAICEARIPPALERGLEACGGDPTAEREFGLAYAAGQCDELLAAGVEGIHFYTLNRASPTVAILGALRASRPWDRAGGGAAPPPVQALSSPFL